MAYVTVTNFQLTVDGHIIDTVSNHLMMKLRIEYAGAIDGIFPGDTILIDIDNAASELFRIAGLGGSTVNIYGDGDIGKVGTKTYINKPDGNYSVEVTFDDGYYNYYDGQMPGNITGWLEASVYVMYKKWVQVKTTTDIEITINGIHLSKPVHVEPGGEPAPERLNTPGPVIGKSGRYGDHSGNLGDLPEVSQNDYQNFEPIRWSLQAGYQNLTWRDLRATNGAAYYTTHDSLAYSNANPTGPRYQSSVESYLQPYSQEMGYPIDAPYLHKNCVLEDYLVVGKFGQEISSAQEYVEDSLRIIRVMGRQENNDWWGKDGFRVLADKNFLKAAPGEPVDRYLTTLYFSGYRGLTIDEFLAQMHSEGQLLDKTTVDDILTFKHVNNGDAPGTSDPSDTTQIPHFKLLLGDLHFNEDTRAIDLIGFDNTVIFDDVDAANLPYAYLVYYDTKATEAILHRGSFHYNNSAKFMFDGETRTVTSVDIWVKLEDGSGGSGSTSEIRIRKIDEDGLVVPGVKFTLTQTNIFPVKIREAFTTINGTASFTVQPGTFTLEEELPLGSGLSPVAPMEFTVANVEELLDLRKLLQGSGYPDMELLDYENGVNIITNRKHKPPSPIDVELIMSKIAIGSSLSGGEFTFGIFAQDDTELYRTTNDAAGLITFTVRFSSVGSYHYTVKEILSPPDWDKDTKEWPVEIEVVLLGNELNAIVSYPNGTPVFINTHHSVTCGSFIFPELIFDAPGIYEYTLEELTPSGGGWTTDDRIIKVIVTVVADKHGNLIATVSYPDGFPSFKNIYKTTPARIIISGCKTAVGAPLPAGWFRFGLFDKDGKLIYSVTNQSAEEI